MTDHKEEQELELEALSSIYPEEFSREFLEMIPYKLNYLAVRLSFLSNAQFSYYLILDYIMPHSIHVVCCYCIKNNSQKLFA